MGLQDWGDNAATVICPVADFDRPIWKYHAAAYRVTMIEGGRIAQNICLLATALGVHRVTQSVVHALVLGTPQHLVNQHRFDPSGR